MKITLRRESCTAQYFQENLDSNTPLDMILIPGGDYMMGAPDGEPKSYEDEIPQHFVKVPAFFLGKCPVTQAQYEAVMDENPSHFKGETDSPNQPVENVYWHDAVEFCRRLAARSGRPYRLPSEAEWEYACRARTKTPFHFGAVITPDLANFNWTESYQNSPTKSKSSDKTTPVGKYYPNAFGLYDLHGNVWEWCEDDWHSDYTGAPTDGSAWIDEPRSKDGRRVRRGGSWVDDPWNCRSAFRLYSYAVGRSISGFRVCCSAPRTP